MCCTRRWEGNLSRWRRRCRCANPPQDLAQTHPFVFLASHTAMYTSSTHFSRCIVQWWWWWGVQQVFARLFHSAFCTLHCIALVVVVVVGECSRSLPDCGSGEATSIPGSGLGAPCLKGFLYFGVILVLWIVRLLDNMHLFTPIVTYIGVADLLAV